MSKYIQKLWASRDWHIVARYMWYLTTTPECTTEQREDLLFLARVATTLRDM